MSGETPAQDPRLAELEREIREAQAAAQRAARAAYPPGASGPIATIVNESRLAILEGYVIALAAQNVLDGREDAATVPTTPEMFHKQSMIELRDYWRSVTREIHDSVDNASRIITPNGRR